MSLVTFDQAVQMAMSRHQAGDLSGAEEYYKQIIRQAPQRAEVMNLMGVCVHQQGRNDEAERWFDEAIALRPAEGAFYTHRGMARLSQGRHIEAVGDFHTGVEIAPTPQALNNLGNGLRAMKNWPAAIAVYQAVLGQEPDFAEALFNLGLVHAQCADVRAAADCFDRVVSIRPDFPQAGDYLFTASTLLARAARQTRDWPQAVHRFGRAAAVRPNDLPTLIELAAACVADDKPADAITVYRRALAIDPTSIPLLNDLGNALRSTGQIDESLAVYQSAMALVRPGVTPDTTIADLRINFGTALGDAGRVPEAEAELSLAVGVPDRAAEAHHAMGNLLIKQSALADAIARYETAIALRPDYADAMSNLGTALEETGRFAEARAMYQRAIQIKPDSVGAPWNLALLQLLEGNFVEGFVGYEHRWRQPKMRAMRRDFSQPIWDGTSPSGRTIVLHAEQGFGDAIQFARYVPLVAARGAIVIVEVPGPLVKLFRSLPGVTAVAEFGKPLPPFDLHCPLMSLPRIFGTTVTTIPAAIPYLFAPDPTEPKTPRTRPRIGLVFSGNPHHARDRQRSIPPDLLRPLASPDVDWIGLQIGPPLPVPPELKLDQVGQSLTDFADTAAVIAGLDLVVTVDTATAHLAGALGKPVWLLLAFYPDWRWMLSRPDSPWYPTMRLFRQRTPGDWPGVIAAVAAAISILT